jgi:hypothetical protein
MRCGCRQQDHVVDGHSPAVDGRACTRQGCDRPQTSGPSDFFAPISHCTMGIQLSFAN